MTDLIFKFCVAAGPFLGAALGWKLSKNKSEADLKKIAAETEHLVVDTDACQIRNFNSLIAVYKEISEDLKEKIQDYHNECLKLRKEVSALREENAHLKEQLGNLDSLLKEMQKQSN